MNFKQDASYCDNAWICILLLKRNQLNSVQQSLNPKFPITWVGYIHESFYDHLLLSRIISSTGFLSVMLFFIIPMQVFFWLSSVHLSIWIKYLLRRNQERLISSFPCMGSWCPCFWFQVVLFLGIHIFLSFQYTWASLVDNWCLPMSTFDRFDDHNLLLFTSHEFYFQVSRTDLC